ncbi:MAG: hypothetical protein JWO30_3922 [Fibrobacteres bacterium]|nr:hypothetical protein [Fibrobacterota bacterium]
MDTMRVSKVALAFGLALALFPLGALAAEAAKSAAEAAVEAVKPDFMPWQNFLTRYLRTGTRDGVNRVRYAAVTPADKAALNAFLKSMQAEKPSVLGADAQRAFWINLYNAQTVAVVLNAFPLKSIRDIKMPGSKSQGPWDATLLKMEGKDLSLNDIENGILRTQWKDNRIHFALNCASIGCPNLSPRAFTAANLEAQLEKGAKDYLRSTRGAAFEGEVLKLSSIFDWYKGDFGKTDKEMLEALSRFTGPEMGKRLKEYSGKIEYRYDWNLNGD